MRGVRLRADAAKQIVGCYQNYVPRNMTTNRLDATTYFLIIDIPSISDTYACNGCRSVQAAALRW